MRWWWLLAGAILLLPPAALADGCFFKERRFAAPPAIPAQRALIIHKDGVERLVVESTADPEGQTFGWILPLPAKPTSVEVATPGVLDTLDLATRPEIRSRGSWFEVLGTAWILALLLLTLRLYGERRQGRPTLPPWAETLVVALLLVSVGWVILVPNLLAARQGRSPVSVPGVAASDAQRVGSYEVTLLEAKDGAALGAWLERNGLAAVPAAGRLIVNDYVARGWVFVAARLVREGSGPAAPHPLSVVFPAAKPIYPMRLTALAGGVTNLRLYVAAGGSAACAPLAIRFSGEFREVDAAELWEPEGDIDRVLASGGSLERRVLSHPFLLEHLRRACVVTRLEGDMAAASMDRDLVFEVGATEPRIHLLYTSAEAWRTGFRRVLPFWALAMLVVSALPGPMLPRLGGSGFPWLRWTLLLAAVSALAGTGVRMSLPTIPEEAIVSRRPHVVWGTDESDLLRDTDLYAGKPLAEVSALLERRFRETRLLNPWTGRPVRWSDSPGDVQLFEDHRGPVLRIATLGGARDDRPWFTERLHWILEIRPGAGRKGTAAQAREWIFPAGVFADGLLNPFTGAPVREGRSPGDAEVLDEDGSVLVRAWFREGKHEDFVLR